MNSEQAFARGAIEALRSGVPSRHVVEQLGTTQDNVEAAFSSRLNAVATGLPVEPIVLSATFGGGKSHLLNYLKEIAGKEGFVTSLVVVSPEMPVGNPHLVLKALAEAADAPGRVGRATQALSPDLNSNAMALTNLRKWARDAGLDERFPAMLHLYEELRADEGFRSEILNDFEGSPIVITMLRQKLKELGQASGYALRGKKNGLLAHDRIRLLAQLFRATTSKGWVVLFDELERFTTFTVRQRLAAWEELGWWRAAAQTDGAALLPVFTTANEAIEQKAEIDSPRFVPQGLGLDVEARDDLGLRGIELALAQTRLIPPSPEQEAVIKYRVQQIYESAYGVKTQAIEQRTAGTTVRAEIRRWITLWDLHRYYPEYRPTIQQDSVVLDDRPVEDDVILGDGDAEID